MTFDMHENYPAAIGFYPPQVGRTHVPDPRALPRLRVRRCPKGVDRVVAVVDESAERVKAMGVRPERIVVFSNVDDTDVARARGRGSPSRSRSRTPAGSARIGASTCSSGRSPSSARPFRAHASCSWDATSRFRSSPELAESLGVADAVEWTGWVDARRDARATLRGLGRRRCRIAATSTPIRPCPTSCSSTWRWACLSRSPTARRSRESFTRRARAPSRRRAIRSTSQRSSPSLPIRERADGGVRGGSRWPSLSATTCARRARTS